ncbi:MAG: hypothetical protein AAGF81_04060, partial [Pseudomonadota bacterium]
WCYRYCRVEVSSRGFYDICSIGGYLRPKCNQFEEINVRVVFFSIIKSISGLVEPKIDSFCSFVIVMRLNSKFYFLTRSPFPEHLQLLSDYMAKHPAVIPNEKQEAAERLCF